MGFHICQYCGEATSSGDVTLIFPGELVWEVPDMILHYIAVHDWLPPEPFIDAVMRDEPIPEIPRGKRFQPVKLGYLTEPLEQLPKHNGDLPAGFFMRLWMCLEHAKTHGRRSQTRGL